MVIGFNVNDICSKSFEDSRYVCICNKKYYTAPNVKYKYKILAYWEKDHNKQNETKPFSFLFFDCSKIFLESRTNLIIKTIELIMNSKEHYCA